MECEQSQTWNWQLTQKNGVSHVLPRGLIFIGCQECDIILPSPGIEKRHAVISYNADHRDFYIKDLNSLTGTFVNGTRIAEQLYIKLNPEDTIRLGYGPVFTLTQAESRSPSHLQECPEFPKLEETSLHDSLEDICDIPLHSEEKSIVPSPLVADYSNRVSEVGSPTKIMHFPSPTKSPLAEKTSFMDIAIVNRSPVRTLCKDESVNLVNNNNSNNTESDGSPSEGQFSNSSSGRTPENPQPTAMAFTIPFDLEMPKKKIRAREGISRFASSKSDSENGHLYRSPVLSSRKDDRQLSEKVNGSSRELPSPPSSKTNGSPLNDSASYLIHKMLGGDSGDDAYVVPKQGALQNRKFSLERRKPSPTFSGGEKHSPDYSLPHSPCSPVKPRERDADEKSETGTYTVELEQNDPDVEEARKKIDEVFGVYKPSDKMPPRQTSKESNGVPFGQHRSHNGSDMSDRDSGSSREPAPVIRPKRRLPTPPIEKVNLNFDVGHTRENSYPTVSIKGRRGDTFIQDYPAAKPPLPNNNNNHCSITPKPPPRFYSSKSQSEQRSDSVYGRTDPRPLHRQSSGGSHPDAGTCGSLSDSGSNKQFFGSPWRRMSWNRSCSDLELDQSKSDSASVVSDISTSTEPSSHSSGRNKATEVGPQMRLNRAFALRRARLGFETDDLQPSSARTAGKPMPRAGDHSSHSSPNSLSRQDGGRFSLRLPRSTTVRLSKVNSKPPETKVVRHPQAWAAASSKPEPPKMFQKPAVTRLAKSAKEVSLKKTKSLKNLNTTIETKCANRTRNSDLQKSASFAHSGELKTEKPPATRKVLSAKKERPTSASSTQRTKAVLNSKKSEQAKEREAKEPTGTADETGVSQKAKREVSALDSLVISAIYQLSSKLKVGASTLLERERQKHPESSDSRLMIDELLPQMGDKKPCEMSAEGNLTRDLSSILRNLKRVEQVVEVMTVLGEQQSGASKDSHRREKGGFFIVDV